MTKIVGSGHAQPSPIIGQDASDITSRSASDNSSSGTSASDDGDWFAEAAQDLLSKPGLELSLTTGFDESLCYKYASGKVRPPAYFLRAILRDDRGEPFLDYLMHGSKAPWWLAFKRARRICAEEDKIDRS